MVTVLSLKKSVSLFPLLHGFGEINFFLFLSKPCRTSVYFREASYRKRLQQREDTKDDVNIMEPLNCLTQRQPNAESYLQKLRSCNFISE